MFIKECRDSKEEIPKWEKDYYTICGKVGFSQCDEEQRMRLSAIINAFQDISCFHSEELGVGFYYLQPKKLAWIIYYWELEIDRLPGYFEDIVVGTCPTNTKGFFNNRSYFIKDKNLQYIVRGNSLWILMDREKLMPARPDDYIKNAYHYGAPVEMENHRRRIDLPDSPDSRTEGDSIIVSDYHLDFNGHVNNGKYVEMAFDAFRSRSDRRQESIRRLRVEYTKEAHLGDKITPVIYQCQNKLLCSLEDGGTSECYAKIEVENV